MGRLIISETERKNILSLYEATNVTPPPSESVLVVNKNPFKYPEFENARKTYNSELKDGDLFYIVQNYKYEKKITTEFNQNFIKDLYYKSAKYDDIIYRFISPNVNESTTSYPYGIGKIGIQVNGSDIENYSVRRARTKVENEFIIDFEKNNKSGLNNSIWIPSIQQLYNKNYKEEVLPKLKIETVPDEYFEIRKIQRETTDF